MVWWYFSFFDFVPRCFCFYESTVDGSLADLINRGLLLSSEEMLAIANEINEPEKSEARGNHEAEGGP